jgi:hypothetical protein
VAPARSLVPGGYPVVLFRVSAAGQLPGFSHMRAGKALAPYEKVGDK